MLELLLHYETWMILGLSLIAIDVLVGLDFVLLSFGVGALSAGISLLLKESLAIPYANSWEGILTFFAIFSLAVMLPLRHYARRSPGSVGDEDINKY